MNVGITGGSGFIGQFLIAELLKKGHTIRNIDLVGPRIIPVSEKCSYIAGDIRDKQKMASICPGLDIIIHLAAAHKDFGIARDEYFNVNQEGTRTVLEAMVVADIRSIVFYSSVAVYKAGMPGITELTVPDPQNFYGESKLAGEKEIETWLTKAQGRRAIVIRPTVVFGPRNLANMYNLIDQVNKGRYLFHIGDGTNVKSIAYVENLVAFTAFLLENRAQSLKAHEVFNYIDYPQLTIRETMAEIHSALKRKMPSVTLPMAIPLLAGRIFDLAIALSGKNLPISSYRIRKIAANTRFEAPRVKELGFSPPVDLREGIRRMVAWYLQDRATKV